MLVDAGLNASQRRFANTACGRGTGSDVVNPGTATTSTPTPPYFPSPSPSCFPITQWPRLCDMSVSAVRSAAHVCQGRKHRGRGLRQREPGHPRGGRAGESELATMPHHDMTAYE